MVLALVLPGANIALADSTTGELSGTIKTATGTPVSGAKVSIASPSSSRTATTDAKGFYSLQGVNPDTYTVTVIAAGYSDVVQQGVNVSAGIQTTFSPQLSTALRTIGRTSARSSSSAYQPTQTVNTYTVNEQTIQTILGNEFNNNESDLITALPGASLDSSGYPVLRGGRENEEGFQFDGIDYTDAFTHQFVNSLDLIGQSQFQLTPGAGDASTGNAGTGAINIIVKRGTYPAFGTADFEAGTPAFSHQFSFEYGIASANGQLSDYVSYIGQRQYQIYGDRTANRIEIGQSVQDTYNTNDDLVNNFVYKFGKDRNQSIQFLYQNQQSNFYEQAAPGTDFQFRSNDPLSLGVFNSITGLSNTTLQSIYGYTFGQSNIVQSLASVNRNPETYYQPNDTLKFQYSNNINSTTFLTAKFYKVQSVVTFDFPYYFSSTGSTSIYGDFQSLQGGQRTGGAIDLTKQFGSKNLITLGTRYDYLHPSYSFGSASAGVFNVAAVGEIYDFVPATNPDCTGALTAAFGANPCGYLSKYFPNGIPRVPVYDNTTVTNRQDYAFYLNDAFTPTTRLKVEAGLRFDLSNNQLPTITSDSYLPATGGGYSSGYYLPVQTGLDANGNADPSKDVYAPLTGAVKSPLVVEPRFATAWQFRPTDSIRVSYGRSASFVPLGDVDHAVSRSAFTAFKGIPGTGINLCGPTFDRACRDYADQLYWTYVNIFSGVPVQPAKPSTFNNYDASYSHDFGHGVGVKLTPFYRRGYDGLALVSTPLLVNGQTVQNPDGSLVLNPATTTNNGSTRTTGVEFYLTKEARVGLSGSLSATYINEFSNVIPGSVNEDFFPSIPLPSLQLGNQYRVGFISPFNVTLAAAYRTRGGFKVSPNIAWNRGYPYGSGLITAATIAGKPYNVPQTNVSFGLNGNGNQATNYVDPQNPGSVFAPNIAATRGTPEGPSAGSYLSSPRFRTNIDFEYQHPGSPHVFGIQVFNLFNQFYGQPILNTRYQPVATGISGPQTGTNALAQLYGAAAGFTNVGLDRFGTSAYTISPTTLAREANFYYQYKF